jgi:hypothetical protein
MVIKAFVVMSWPFSDIWDGSKWVLLELMWKASRLICFSSSSLAMINEQAAKFLLKTEFLLATRKPDEWF